MLWGIDENAVYLSPAPLYHAAPLSFSVGVQSLGGTVVYMPRFDAARALQAIEECKVTHSQWVPTMFSRMLKLEEPERDPPRPGLRTRSPSTPPRPARPGSRNRCSTGGGRSSTSTTPGRRSTDSPTHVRRNGSEHPGTVGKPIMGTIHICDEDGAELPIGETGVVYFEMPTTPFEYLNRPRKDPGSATSGTLQLDDPGRCRLRPTPMASSTSRTAPPT